MFKLLELIDLAENIPVALITGAAKRIGAAIARRLHARPCNIIVHYHHSSIEAEQLVEQLNERRSHSAHAQQFDLTQLESLPQFVQQCLLPWGRLDFLVNNASSFYPTPLEKMEISHWHDLMHTNLGAPLFLAQAVALELRQQGGSIVNLSDIHAERPLKNHTIYCVAKAGQNMLTKSLAREFAPHVRVNGVAPGAILWPPDVQAHQVVQQNILQRIPLARSGTLEDIARAVEFLIFDADYVTGQILYVDGGRSLQD